MISEHSLHIGWLLPWDCTVERRCVTGNRYKTYYPGMSQSVVSQNERRQRHDSLLILASPNLHWVKKKIWEHNMPKIGSHVNAAIKAVTCYLNSAVSGIIPEGVISVLTVLQAPSGLNMATLISSTDTEFII